MIEEWIIDALSPTGARVSSSFDRFSTPRTVIFNRVRFGRPVYDMHGSNLGYHDYDFSLNCYSSVSRSDAALLTEQVVDAIFDMKWSHDSITSVESFDGNQLPKDGVNYGYTVLVSFTLYKEQD